MMKVLNSKGFGTTEILLLILVVAVVGFGGYYVWNTQNNKPTSQSSQNEAGNNNTSSESARNQDTGAPNAGQAVTSEIKLVTGQYTPSNVIVKKGTKVTWTITDSGEIPNYGIESDNNSTEKFSSELLKTGDSFSYTFDNVGSFGWHDKYNGGLTGTVTVEN
jgi:plastocyanin